MADPFRCTLVTPVAQMFDRDVTSVILPAHDGQMGVLHLHAPMMVQLGQGELKVMPADGGAEQVLSIKGGFAQVKDNKLVVLTDEATEVAEVAAAS